MNERLLTQQWLIWNSASQKSGVVCTKKKGKVVPSAEVSAVSCIASGALLASDADAAADVVGTEL